MSKIKLLDKNLINKIAAGEVVERPSSVVKELVENSIDAKSSAITIEIKDGGIKLIRITDNGVGILSEDVENAFKRHATSKISSETDLNNIYSLGFRGEALASIASISQVEMITKTIEELVGTRIEIHGGNLFLKEEVGVPEGTTLIIKNIFYNTPARLEFLKSESSESAAISEIIDKLALAHPEVSFKFINNGKIILHTAGNNNLQNVILNVYGRDIYKNLVNIDYASDEITVKGYIGKPEINKSNRKYENIFLNGRYIKSDIISRAVEEGFKSFIMLNKFPFFTLHININPSLVDVNVHPTKMEVRFTNEEFIFDLISKIVFDSLQSLVLIPVVLGEKNTEEVKGKNLEIKEPFEIKNNFKSSEIVIPKVENLKRDEIVVFQKPKEVKQDIIFESVEQKYESKIIDYKIIGQVFNTYWVVQQEENMYFIDQHAAHEKVLYEKYLMEYNNSKTLSQRLVAPITVELPSSEFMFINENINLFNDFGFEIEEFGQNTYAIRSVPLIMKGQLSKDLFVEILDDMMLGYKKTNENIEHYLATAACKAAVKANDKLSIAECENLITELFKLENPYNCPHGRPVIISMTKYELEKKFKRIV